MELVFPRAEDDWSAVPGAAPVASLAAAEKRGVTGKRKGPNLESMNEVGSSKRVTGTIPYRSWCDRQYADVQAYFRRKRSHERNDKGCYRWIAKGKAGSDGAVASFCGVRYNAQLLFYLANHRDVEMRPREEIIASCGDKRCLTLEHLALASAPAARAAGKRITPCYSIEQWRAKTGTLEDEMMEVVAP